MSRYLLVLWVCLSFIVLTSCATKPISDKSIMPQSAPVSISGQEAREKAKEAWEIKWDKIMQDAKKEGKVTIYGPGGEIRITLIKAFTEKYGITVDYLGATGPEVSAKIVAERRAGLYIPDTIIGASSPVITTLKPNGYLVPIEPILILPDVLDTKLWWDKEFPWVDKGHYAIAFQAYANYPILINTELVKPEEMKSLRNLLEPRWKGKIVMLDPSIYGPTQTFMAAQVELIGVEYFRQLALQEPLITRDKRLIAEWVAKSKYPIGIGSGEAAEEFINAGSPLRFVETSEPTYVTSGTGFLSLPGNAPHPNASALFINWLLSREGQIAYTGATKQQSARDDIPTTNLNQIYLRKPGVKYFVQNEEFLLKGSEQLQLGREIFGHLMK